MIACFSLVRFSVATLARIMNRPRPVLYACGMPLLPYRNPPVGKSGPCTCFSTSASPAFGFLTSSIAAFTTSVRLCGGMLVAMPTAMPLDPFTIRLGMRVGSTVGSKVDSS